MRVQSKLQCRSCWLYRRIYHRSASPDFHNRFKLHNDAKACFDRILNSHAMLHSCKFEVLDKNCKINSNTLCNMEYRVQIPLGTFQSHYKYSTISPIHDTCQGSGFSGTHWVYIGISMVSTLEQQNKRCTIIRSDNSITWMKKIIGFVDDKHEYTNYCKHNSLLTVANILQPLK